MLCSAVNYTLGKTVPFVYGPAGPITVLDSITANGVTFRLADLRYMATMLHVVEALQSQYILAQADVMSYAYGALSSLVFAVPHGSSDCRIPYCVRN